MIITNHPNDGDCIEYMLEVERMIDEGGGVFEEWNARTGTTPSEGRNPEQESG